MPYFDLIQIGSASMVLFAVIDIVGSIPIVIELRQRVGHIQSEKASIAAGVLMIIFLFVGESILNLIGVDVSSFAIAGSLIIFFLALELILGIQIYKDEMPQTASIMPLAFPLIAGAGTLTSILSLRAEYEVQNIIVAIVINILFVYFVLKTSKRIENVLGASGIAVIRKVFGVVLLSIAIKLFKTNLGIGL